jgi:hypothetical protein
LEFFSSWQPIKLAWTKTIIALGKLGEDTLIDAVPLDEVSDIHVMQEGSSMTPLPIQIEKSSSAADLENSQTKSNQSLKHQSSMWMPRMSKKMLNSSKNLSAPQLNDAQPPCIGKGLTAGPMMLIMTDENGYNSGRKYYFQTKSDAERREIMDALVTRSKLARTSKEAKGKLERIRERVSDFTKSDSFQYFFAFLIAMVTMKHQNFFYIL